jgi:hypothetical protein
VIYMLEHKKNPGDGYYKRQFHWAVISRAFTSREEGTLVFSVFYIAMINRTEAS